MTDAEWLENRTRLWRRWLRVKDLDEWHQQHRQPSRDRASQRWRRLDALLILRGRIMREIAETK